MEQYHRRCVSCRRTAHRNEFFRVVRLYPGQSIQLEQGMGRSAYLCQGEACLKVAQKKNALGRALRIAIPADIYGQIQTRLSSLSP
jgi:uncharacterized protein